MNNRTFIQRLKKYCNISEWQILYLVVSNIISMIIFFVLHKRELNRIKTKLNKKIWLFCERGDDARDNAYILFKYVRENCPEIAAYYVIDEKTTDIIDYENVKNIGNIIHRNTVEHKLHFMLADVLLDTHLIGRIMPWNIDAFAKLQFIKDFNKSFVFLQHGITFHDLSTKLNKQNNDFDIFICGAKPEYEYILKSFGFDDKVVKYTGFARYDNLHDIQTKNQILLMPTWRQYIVQPSFKKDEIVSDKEFLNTLYFKTYQNLINNKKLQKILDENNIELIFYPHFEVQQYLQYFKTPSKNITVANKENYDVQTLLKESKLLITDYSSVFFDFAYMNKPSIFYQFDEAEFFDKHYKKGYFDYREDGFGGVVIRDDELINNIEKVIESNFEMEEKYKNRIEGFFPLHDKKNCERIVDVIKDLK